MRHSNDENPTFFTNSISDLCVAMCMYCIIPLIGLKAADVIIGVCKCGGLCVNVCVCV